MTMISHWLSFHAECPPLAAHDLGKLVLCIIDIQRLHASQRHPVEIQAHMIYAKIRAFSASPSRRTPPMNITGDDDVSH